MFHLRAEGHPIKAGFNFYPWSERKSSIGFVFSLGSFRWHLRYAPHMRVLYNTAAHY